VKKEARVQPAIQLNATEPPDYDLPARGKSHPIIF
jgi:hypothetical protein